MKAPCAGNLLRNDGQRGFNSMAKMYMIEHALQGADAGGSRAR